MASKSKKKPLAGKSKVNRTGLGSAPSRRGQSGVASEPGYQAKVRMYRQGLGDCFLVTLPRAGNRPYYIMIDCGVILGTKNPGTIMSQVVENITAATGGEIDLLIATHEHWDHLSGFVQAKDAFDRLKVGEVWLGWTEDPDDELARKFNKEKGLALSALRMGLSQLQLGGAADTAEDLAGILEFFGATKGGTTGDALNYVKNKTTKPRYCLPADPPVELAGVGARLYVLGPPHDGTQLRKINPSARNQETYGFEVDGFRMLFMDGAGSALGEGDSGRPFDQQYEIPFAYAKAAPDLDFFRQHYWQPDGAAPDNWRRIDTDWLGGSPEMALQLDSLTNNTSLVIAIELKGGDVLLFAADAQVGNWLSWQDLKWTVDGKTVTGPDLLKRAILYKVGHHGSHNATLREKGLDQMKSLRVAMIPVDHEMAKTKRWNKMPLDELVAALKDRATGAVLRVDEPMPVTQENVIEDELFFEVTF